MKKRYLSLMMAACMVITPVTVNAAMTDDNFSYMSEFEGGTADTELSYFQNSTYLVKIPLRINNIVEAGYVFTADSINILDNQSVNVYVENSSVKMTNERGDTCSLELRCSDEKGKQGLVGTFKNGETTSSVTMNAQMSPGARAGSYVGTATFSVRLE
ncbi:hypothetical protein DW952_17465 [Ruminococcus sp. AM44-9AT]|jgi:hypothetical protein|nr:hypothetical protein DW952_17465 [Ruminococcus sp. AM44-9AT]